jgi:hypothetical protein
MNTLYNDPDDTEYLLPFLDGNLSEFPEVGPKNPNRQKPKSAWKLLNSSLGSMLQNPETSDPTTFSVVRN